ncbi:MAG: thiamine phosphate synthase [Mucilaginibacter sp.]|uniref:thiamine phosphate synthase n=1 Tax=Mucilaginibacter sp. TaxID=1882438 RepID=UPI003265C7FD
MELIVISDPGAVADEASIINRLFEAGMTRFHLRKPDWKIDQFIDLLLGIDPTFYNAIALHQQHYLTGTFGIKRLHYTENQRVITGTEKLTQQNQKGYTLSTSVHHIAHISLLEYFDYAFFSPVFNSISKPGYQSQLEDGFRLEKVNALPKVIALGGIDETNLERVREMNFDGAAVLGAIWNDPYQAVATFKRLKDLANN